MENNFDNLDPADQSLDELLGKARWPELPPEAGARLKTHILSMRSSRHSRRAIGFFAAMAASLLLAIGLAYLLVRRAITSNQNASVTVAATPALPFGEEPQGGDAGVAATGSQADKALPGRAPTVYEAWYLAQPPNHPIAVAKAAPVAELKEAQPADRYKNADSPALVFAFARESDESTRQAIFQSLLSRPDGMDHVLDLILNSSTRERTLASLHALPQPPTNQLLAKLDSPSMARRFAAAKALGSLCRGQTLPTLKEMITRDNHRREALAVLGQCQDSAAVAYVHELQHQPAVASEMAAVRNEMKQLF